MVFNNSLTLNRRLQVRHFSVHNNQMVHHCETRIDPSLVAISLLRPRQQPVYIVQHDFASFRIRDHEAENAYFRDRVDHLQLASSQHQGLQ